MKTPEIPNSNPQAVDSVSDSVKRFKALTEKAPAKVPFLKKTVVRVAGAILAAGAVLAGGAYELGTHGIIDVPGIHQKIDVPSIYDGNSDKTQGIKAGPGGNAQPITIEAVKELINQVTPVFEQPKPGEQAPKVEMILPVNPEKATVSVTRIPRQGGSESSPYYDSDEDIHISGVDAPFYLPIVTGAKKLSMTACGTNGVITYLELTYSLNNGQPLHARVNFGDTNYVFTDILKSVPTFNTNRNYKIEDMPVKEFDLSL
jgi:hypothetical protein